MRDFPLDSTLMQTLVEQFDDMVFLIRIEDAAIIYSNPCAETTLGYSKEELRELGINRLRRPFKPVEDFSTHLEELDARQSMIDYAMVICKDGREIPVEVRAKMVTIDGVACNLAIVRDISERYSQGILYRDFVEGSNELLVRIDPQGTISYANPTAETLLGVSALKCIGRSLFDFLHPEDRDAAERVFAGWIGEHRTFATYEARQLNLSGDMHHIFWHVRIHYDSSGNVQYANITGSDISPRVEAEQELARLNSELEEKVRLRTRALEQNSAFLEGYKLALDTNNIVSKSDRHGRITYVNDNFVRVSGYSREEAIGKPHRIVRDPDMPKELFADLWKTILAKKVWTGVLKNRNKSGGYYWVDMAILPILDARGEIFEFIAVRHEITELVDKREALERIAFADALTGLPNRQRLIEDVAACRNASVALINIDRFSQVNDFFGHTVGDGLITMLAHSVREHAAEQGYRVYRLHGDEVAVLCVSGDSENFIIWVQWVVDHLNGELVQIEESEIMYDLSAGVASSSKETLLTYADIALKNAKRSQNNVVVYDEHLALGKQYESNLLWSKKLRDAIRGERITVYYQPIINNETGRCEKHEALLRMIDDDGSVITPFYFLGIAKKSRQYHELTRIVIEQTFATFRHREGNVSINLTIDDILEPDLRTLLFERIKSSGMGERIIFELVESEGIENFDAVREFVSRVKEMGCRLAIDDFGTGYSNFVYLMRLRADLIKIDGSLIRNIDTNTQARDIVATIVAFAKKSGLKTVAEFVHSEAVQQEVVALGIDYSQGFYFSEPLPEPLPPEDQA